MVEDKDVAKGAILLAIIMHCAACPVPPVGGLRKNTRTAGCIYRLHERTDRRDDAIWLNSAGAVLPYDVNVQDQLDQYPAAGTPVKKIGRVPFYKRLLWEGGRPIDAFLTIVSAQVGPATGWQPGFCVLMYVSMKLNSMQCAATLTADCACQLA
jgi:hypothetical protein